MGFGGSESGRLYFLSFALVVIAFIEQKYEFKNNDKNDV